LTRPAPDNAATAAALAPLGVETIMAPVIEIVPLSGPAPDLDGADAIAVTSANGVRALAGRTARRDRPVFAVGTATAAAARAAGFGDVRVAEGDARALAGLIARQLPRGARILHAAGTTRAADLAALLDPAGIGVETAAVYEARPRERLPAEALAALRHKAVDGVLFFSPRSARLFVSLSDKERLGEAAAALVAFCLSEQVAEALREAWPAMSIVIADRPAQEALIDSIARHFHLSAKPDRT